MTCHRRSSSCWQLAPLGVLDKIAHLLTVTALLFLLLSQTSIAAEAAAAASTVNHTKAQLDWIVQHGGLVSPKIQFRPDGMFVNANVEQDETLLIIPHECVLSPYANKVKKKKQRNKECSAALTLVEERLLGASSHYAPYVDYVFDSRHHGQVPTTWSDKGKDLIEVIVGDEVPPYDVTGVLFDKHCSRGDAEREALQNEAYQIVMRRGWEEYLVPVLDMVNHRNGRWRNIESNSVKTNENVVVFARRPIQAGEQLYLSYNECTDCNYALTYTLPHILKDFGFVEQYPRRWTFDFDDAGEDESVVFELDESAANGEIELKWLSGEPDEHEMRFFRDELGRLVDLGHYVAKHAAELESEYERSVSVEYYNAFKMALEYVMRDQADGDYDDYDDEEKVSRRATVDKTCPDAA